MTSYRHLAEADAFRRRRLVAAFVSGGRMAEPQESPRTFPCILGGLALVIVLAAGAAVGSAVTGHPAAAWEHGRLRVTP